jgi:hypothetical protein
MEQALQGPDGLASPLDRRERGAGVGEEGGPRGGQGDAARVAVEQRLTQLPFEAAELGTDRRLRDGDPLGGPRHLPLLGDGDEVGQLSEPSSATRSRLSRRSSGTITEI